MCTRPLCGHRFLSLLHSIAFNFAASAFNLKSPKMICVFFDFHVNLYFFLKKTKKEPLDQSNMCTKHCIYEYEMMIIDLWMGWVKQGESGEFDTFKHPWSDSKLETRLVNICHFTSVEKGCWGLLVCSLCVELACFCFYFRAFFLLCAR